jgi:hypothetical protein
MTDENLTTSAPSNDETRTRYVRGILHKDLQAAFRELASACAELSDHIKAGAIDHDSATAYLAKVESQLRELSELAGLDTGDATAD